MDSAHKGTAVTTPWSGAYGCFAFDASRSNTTYGSSATVTPLSLSTKFFIKY